MTKIFFIFLIFVTTSIAYKLEEENNIFPKKIYSAEIKQKNNEVFPSSILIEDDDVYINELKETISNKLIDKNNIDQGSFNFLMCFILEIKPFVHNQSDFQYFKTERKTLDLRQKIIIKCSRQSKIDVNSFNKFITILNEI